jgi:hypothetical protein
LLARAGRSAATLTTRDRKGGLVAKVRNTESGSGRDELAPPAGAAEVLERRDLAADDDGKAAGPPAAAPPSTAAQRVQYRVRTRRDDRRS